MSLPLLVLPVHCAQVLRLRDAVWATTQGVGRAHRAASAQVAAASNLKQADDEAYIPKLNCRAPENANHLDCLSPPRPIGLRSKHYFNVGLAVADKGVIVRTVDGGYSWDCLRGCTRTGPQLPELMSISVNVRLGGFGYSQTYYDANGATIVDDRDWTLLQLAQNQPIYTGLDGVHWPDGSQLKMEGFAVGRQGSIVRIADAKVNGWDPTDLNNPQADVPDLQEVNPVNADGTGCRTQSKAVMDVFFWSMHLAFFVGEQGYLCRYGLDIQPATSARGPGQYINDLLDGPSSGIVLRWDAQGSDEQMLNWGRIVDNKDYMYSDLRSVFCLQVCNGAPPSMDPLHGPPPPLGAMDPPHVPPPL